MARIVVALGGNALGKTPEGQLAAVSTTAASIVELLENGHEIILSHGNGPQVGMINLAFEGNQDVPNMPFPECGAMSQGYIGYHLQNAIRTELMKREKKRSICSIITQVIVDKNDTAFGNPTKPVGSFYSQEEAEELTRLNKYVMVEDAGRGYRRVVPSPMPIDIVEIDMIRTLIDNKHLVISCGGGGIPVVKDGENLQGIPAVIDKDLASGKLAELLEADVLLILTVVEKAAIYFQQKNQQWLNNISVAQAQKYMDEGHFSKGSMEPKIQAAINFASSAPGRKTIITSLDKAREGLNGKTGTSIS